jgi:hypothetical protein
MGDKVKKIIGIIDGAEILAMPCNTACDTSLRLIGLALILVEKLALLGQER